MSPCEKCSPDAVLSMEPGADTRAPGAAITVALCGHWEHEPPCPLTPHHTGSTRVGADVHLRTLFAIEPAAAEGIHQRIDTALAVGQLIGPDGHLTRWQLRATQPSAVLPNEAEHAQRLASS